MNMAGDHSEAKLQSVVRRYSDKVAETSPDDTLSQALGVYFQHQDVEQQRRTEPKTKHCTSSFLGETSYNERVTARLEDQRKRLTDMWRKFQSQFDLGDAEVEGNMPSMHDILATVENAEKAWNTKKTSETGKAREGIVNFFNKMNDHSFLFSVIPDRDKYTSLITGVVSSIMKMSVHHKRNAQGFSEALINIGNNLMTLPKSTRISNTPEMRARVIDFYIEVFDFLCHSIEWYQSGWKRFRASLNENFYDDNVKCRVDNIRQALDLIRLEAEQTTQRRIQNVEQGVSEIHTQLKDNADCMREMQRMQREQGVEFERVVEKVFLKVGQGLFQTLMSGGQHAIHDLTYNAYKSLESSNLLQVGENRKGSEFPAEFTRSEIEEQLSSLDAYLDDGRPKNLAAMNLNPKSKLPNEVVLDIEKWIMTPSSKLLWVEGPVSVGLEEQLSIASTCISNLVSNAGIPCVSFYAKHRPKSQLKGVESKMTSREATLIALLYSLVSQVTRLLPAQFESSGPFDKESFLKLDGSIRSASTALELLHAFMDYIPATVVFVVDKLHLADDTSTRPHLIRLISMLKECGLRPNQLIKVFFTTAGACSVLAKTTSISERVNAGRMIQARPGQPLKGWSSLGNLKLP